MEASEHLPPCMIWKKRCPKITHVIENVRIPLIEEIALTGTSVLNKAFEFLINEKHRKKLNILFAEKI